MNIDFTKDHFTLFALPVSFDVDGEALDRAYRDLQREVHPDRHAHAGQAEQRVAAQWSTHLNEAHRVLKSPVARGRYLLQLNGISTDEETDTAMPTDFLVAQMEWREAVDVARRSGDEIALERLSTDERHARRALIDALRTALRDRQWHAAREAVRKLRFMDKLGEEIGLAAEAMDA